MKPPARTAIVATVVANDPWSDHREQLASITAALEEADNVLYELRIARAQAVIEASDDGMPQREIGAELGISHTMVQKIIAEEAGRLEIVETIRSMRI